jgi:hypothetical protein
VDFHTILATTRDLYDSIRAEMQTASEISIQKTHWTPSGMEFSRNACHPSNLNRSDAAVSEEHDVFLSRVSKYL